MTVIAHLSDLHFGKENRRNLTALKNQLGEISPHLAVITGDLTQRGTRRQYQSARKFLQSLSAGYIAVPGNHDLPIHRLYERFQYPWKRWSRFISKNTEPVYCTENLFVMGLNTVFPMGYRLNWTRGRITSGKIQQILNRKENDGPNTLRVIALHHPLWLPEEYRHRKTAGNAIAALKAFSASGIDLVLSGHVHAGFVKLHAGVILANAGSTVSTRLKRGQNNEFNLISVDNDEIEIKKMVWERHDYKSAEKWRFKNDGREWRKTSTEKKEEE